MDAEMKEILQTLSESFEKNQKTENNAKLRLWISLISPIISLLIAVFAIIKMANVVENSFLELQNKQKEIVKKQEFNNGVIQHELNSSGSHIQLMPLQ